MGTPSLLQHQELAPAAPDVAASVASLEGRPELNALVTGERSELLRNALEPARAVIEQQVNADHGDDPAATRARLQRAFSECSVLREALFERMAGEPTTNKGHVRRMLAGYLSLLDRELRLAQALGLERKARSVRSNLEAVVNG